jgi:LuxR family transcriptional regulator, maltose regulon positive regulatory protein
LTSWTAGSPAALHLAVAAVHAGTDMDRVLYEARRVDRPAHDMLLREVLAQQDAEARRFVLATAVTDVCNATLAAAICDMSLPDATRLMGELVAQDLFLEPIRGTSGWFRHHSLYADLLRAVLCHEAPGAVEPLYRRAARWFDAHGCPERAFPCAVAGREWDLVVDLVAHRWIDAAVDGDRCDVYSLREMPDAVASRSAEHLLAACILDLECQRPDDARRRLERVTISRPAPSWHTPLVHDVLTLRLACVDGVPATIDAAAHTLTESAVDPALPADLAERVAALALQGAAVAALATGDTRRAAALFQDAAASSVAGDARNVTTTAWLALTAALAGRMHVAAAINDELAAGWAPAQSDAVKVLRGLTSAICAYHDDRLPSAQQAIADVRAHMTPNACASTVLHAVRARIAASTGDQESAARHLRRAAVTGPAGLLRLVESAVGLPGEGASTATFAHPYDLVLGAIDVAVTQHALGALDAAWTALERALAIAARNGYRRFVVDSGLPVLPVLSSYVVHARPHRAFALELFERMRCDDGSERSGSVETLTERELTVLRYLPTMLSNREIALEMFFSINTVKTHLKSIYRKLDVDRRRDAVDRARALSLI